MAVDPAIIGTELPSTTMTVDEGRLRFFSTVIGHEISADLAVPPTFLFSIELENPNPFAWLANAGVDMRFVLHGEQSFTYHSLAHAGDVLTAKPRIADTYSKGGGALEFIVKETAVSRADGSSVADLSTVIIVRSPAQ
ncbi:FAS1-like dehydratase domain-containing protein [Phytoactinopolyspora limicola]|uniref:FAS1-like dehydratase domain-containing protein n=1 Tax=Phytoactinopolyspora limicola TaxID=2715536 RepID=UPI00140A7756|nr:MaoC family dehydratase N-terminal domain-containing protein [Phytoactinopolyspora limicola]